MPNTAQSDIAYQPAQKGFSYTNSAPAPESSEPKEKKPNVILPLILELLALIIVFVVFLGVLNYFKIISLSFISPKLEILPQKQTKVFIPEIVSTDDSGAITYKTTGTLYEYNGYTAKLNINNQIINFVFDEKRGTLGLDAKGNDTKKVFLLADLETPGNIGRKLTVEFVVDPNGNNLIKGVYLGE